MDGYQQQVLYAQLAHVGKIAHLSKPRKVMDDWSGAALNLHQRDLVFCSHKDVVLVVEHSGQIHTPNEINMTQTKIIHRGRKSMDEEFLNSHTPLATV